MSRASVRSKGFTLIELLITTAAAAVVLPLTYTKKSHAEQQ
ncbi:MAG: prepilin-type N-terminal cleavage/methylation domain-containing protein [Desulfobacterales bacterium]|nr:MAG: prepilin-type N-terminal cleavage/methylation domain-containing protein [Desulfobacterales bacterium]